jgi:hypothetical protein
MIILSYSSYDNSRLPHNPISQGNGESFGGSSMWCPNLSYFSFNSLVVTGAAQNLLFEIRTLWVRKREILGKMGKLK